MTCPKSSCHRNIRVTFPSLHPARWLWAQWGLMLIAHTRCAVVAGLRCSDGLSSVKRQMYRFCRRFLSHTEVSLTGSSMAALLFVGWLCSEECAGNRGGSLWLSQTIPNSFYFLSIALFLSKRPWPWFEPPVFLVWLRAPSDSGQVHMLSLNTGPPIVPIRDSLLRETGHWSDLLLPSLYSVVAAGRGRISFMLVAFNLWRFLLTF